MNKPFSSVKGGDQKSTFRLPKKIHRALKMKAAQTDRPMSDLLVEAVNRYLKSA